MSYFDTQTCEIKRDVDGHTDPDTGQWIEGGVKLIATVEADIQPKSGRERAAELQTEYESDFVAFIDMEDIEIPVQALTILGLTEFEDSVPLTERLEEKGPYVFDQGDIFIDQYDKEYILVYPGFWGDHFELELKEQ